jgi:hypothetical protein
MLEIERLDIECLVQTSAIFNPVNINEVYIKITQRSH